MKTTISAWIVLLFAAGLVLPSVTFSQDTQPGAKKSDDLVHSAEFVRKKLDELLATMSDVASLLEKTDPEAAKILRQTVIYAQQEDVVNKIDEVKRLLRQGLDQAAEAGQSEVIGDLTHMLRLLEGARSDLSETDERLAELRVVRNRLAALLVRQKVEEARSRAVLAKQQIDADSRALLEKLQQLIERQKALRNETGKLPEPSRTVNIISKLHRALLRLTRTQRLLNDSAAKANLARLPVLAEAQRKLLEQTKEAIRELSEPAESESLVKSLSQAAAKARSHCQASITSMRKSAKALEASNKTQADPPAAQALHELTLAENTLAEAVKSLLSKTPAEELAGAQNRLADDTRKLKDIAGSLAEKAGLDPEKLPPSDLPKAARHMDRAVEALEHQDPPPAQAEQTKAIQALQAELDRAKQLREKALARAQARLDAEEQKDIAKRIDKTAETMKKGRDGKSMPGQPSAVKAGQCSGKAGKCLSQSQCDAAGANQQQNESAKNLQEALDALDEEIKKLERLSKAEKLASIAERLEKALERQKACTKQTRAAYDARAKTDPPYDRPAQQKLAELATVEGDLAAEVESIRAMLKKEGTTVVFPAVLGDVKQDLLDVQKSLNEFDPGSLTRATQKDIEQTLEELLESVRKELSKGPGRGMGGGGGGCCKPPLIPPIAELRMLRMKQLRVNRNTKRLDELTRTGNLPDERRQTEHTKLTRRQEQVLELVRDIRAKMKKENQSINPIPPSEENP
ncbi:MAG: hypothetical protein JXA11_16495 [Phycisphaerae bacterium]|nr:hypothetical protein [Phycisphaerae bacterium]